MCKQSETCSECNVLYYGLTITYFLIQSQKLTVSKKLYCSLTIENASCGNIKIYLFISNQKYYVLCINLSPTKKVIFRVQIRQKLLLKVTTTQFLFLQCLVVNYIDVHDCDYQIFFIRYLFIRQQPFVYKKAAFQDQMSEFQPCKQLNTPQKMTLFCQCDSQFL